MTSELTRPKKWGETPEEYEIYLKKHRQLRYVAVNFRTILSDEELDRLWDHFDAGIRTWGDKEHPLDPDYTVCWIVCPALGIEFRYDTSFKLWKSSFFSNSNVSGNLVGIWNKFLHVVEDWLLTHTEIPFLPKKKVNIWKRCYSAEVAEYAPWGSLYRNSPVPTRFGKPWTSAYDWVHQYKTYSSRGEFVYYKFLYNYRDEETGKLKSRYKGSKSRFKKRKWDGDYFDRRITESDDDWRDQMVELKTDYEVWNDAEEQWEDAKELWYREEYQAAHELDYDYDQIDIREYRYFGQKYKPVGYCYHGSRNTLYS
jgi:hypothetical protein